MDLVLTYPVTNLDLTYQSPVRKSQVYKFMDKLPYKITNGKQV
jgi:hypothetical protein